jgi:hypothetical protein
MKLIAMLLERLSYWPRKANVAPVAAAIITNTSPRADNTEIRAFLSLEP